MTTPTTAGDWCARYAEALGTEALDTDDVEALLELAGIAAHASERTAAPISCFLAAAAGRSPVEALEAGRRLAAALEGGATDQRG